MVEPFTAQAAWDELVNKDDRTSPEEYPDHCLISFEELQDFMSRSRDVSPDNVVRSSQESVAWVAFAANGNVRFWTSDPHRTQLEKERGLDLRAFTMAELIALVSRLPAPQSVDDVSSPVTTERADG
jgi:hypothetical protein